jgi:bacterial/archaeal transporter family protein
MSWLPLAITTAAAFGLYNFFIKLGSTKIDQVLGAVVLQVVATLLGGAFLLYLRLAGRTFVVTGAGLGWAALAGIAVGGAEILTFLVFARGAPVALGTPVIMGGAVVMAALLGVLVLRDALGLVQYAGILLVTAGIALLSTGTSH